MSSQELQSHGLVWVPKLFQPEPQWSIEPDIEAIKQTIQPFWPSSAIEVTFTTQGAFNKLYDVRIDDEVLIMRISLPVDPYFKTMSEVATMDWIRCTTSLPVPSIVNYQPSRDNLIGFEWILMTKMIGKPFGDWKSLPFSAKSSLVRKFAAYSACLFRNQLRGIGNIYGKPCLAEDSLTEENPPNRYSADPQIPRNHFEHKHLYRTIEQMLPIPDVHQNQCLKWAELYPTSSSGGLTYTRTSTRPVSFKSGLDQSSPYVQRK